MFTILSAVLLMGATPEARAFSRRPTAPPLEDSFMAEFEASHSQPAGAAVSGRRKLKVLSYNIYGVPLPGVDHTRYRRIGQILAARRAAGTAPQVVLLQEAFHGNSEELVRAAGYPFSVKGPPGEGARYNSGLRVLSEFEITRSSWAVFSQCVSWDCLARKGILHARLKVPGLPQELELYTTHMNADPEDSTFWTDAEESLIVRITQLGEAREFIWETARSQAPLIFAGDFNFHPSGDDYLMFSGGTGFENAAEQCGRSPTSCAWPEGQDPTRDWRGSVDHQFYREGRSPRVDVEPARFEKSFRGPVHQGGKLSDHDGLEIDYALRYPIPK
ncbi:MAG: endonuclease/exonuclease/phosphatase family protein, partial [Bdellovibrionales bacterium]|nr:endonuclease/exonuclease/phosphatase family protein [Bdellovibrionales bacterium]